MSNGSIHLSIVECNFFLFPQNLKFLNTFLVFLITPIRFDLLRFGDSYITKQTTVKNNNLQSTRWTIIMGDLNNRVDKDKEWIKTIENWNVWASTVKKL